MDTLVVHEVTERGLQRGLSFLTPHERDVFVINDLDLCYEMEGGFEDHIPNAPEKFDWLEDTLARIGDLPSLRVIRKLREMSHAPFEETNLLCAQYAERRRVRWELLADYFRKRGVALG
jgi:hypothetical protein